MPIEPLSRLSKLWRKERRENPTLHASAVLVSPGFLALYKDQLVRLWSKSIAVEEPDTGIRHNGTAWLFGRPVISEIGRIEPALRYAKA